MSKKCVAFSKSKIGFEIPNNRKAFYAGWDAGAKAEREACTNVCEPVEGSAYELGVYKTMQTLAAAIRARGEA